MDEPKLIRFDQRLTAVYPDFSRAHLQRLIKQGSASLGKSVVTKPSQPVDAEADVSLDLPTNYDEIPDIELRVLYEDTDCVVVEKPVGLLSHSKGPFNPEATVATWLNKRPDYLLDIENGRGGIVHRLDRATSGVMICAKNRDALGMLQKQFQDRKSKKQYVARIVGHFKQPHALIDLPIERNPKTPQRFRVGANGKPSQTEYEVVTDIGTDSVVLLKPITGRTHQLRVHLEYLGHPIIGDTFYGGRKADRLYLHARSLEIVIPSGEQKIFESKEPEEFYQEKVR